LLRAFKPYSKRDQRIRALRSLPLWKVPNSIRAQSANRRVSRKVVFPRKSAGYCNGIGVTRPRMRRDRAIARVGFLLKKYVDDVTKINYKSVAVSIAPGGGAPPPPILRPARERHARATDRPNRPASLCNRTDVTPRSPDGGAHLARRNPGSRRGVARRFL
jgi:hypothetical protein